MNSLTRSCLAMLALTVLLCGAYPLVVTAIAQALFSDKANGGILEREGKPVGARLIGQPFTKPHYFQGRPSAAGNGYDAANSSGSNLGSTSKKLVDRVKGDIERIRKENPQLKDGAIPTELVTASGGGLDPHLSPEAARVQVPRVAAARGMGEGEVQNLVDKMTDGPDLSVLGEPTVNVLLLNLELDRVHPVKDP